MPPTNNPDDMKRLLLLLAALLPLAFSCTPRQQAAEYPVFWTWADYRGEARFDSLCTWMNQAGVEGVILNARDADAYREAVPIAQKHGIRLFAWFITMSRAEVAAEHPEWMSVNRLGRSLADTTAYVDYYKFMCPALPEVREYLVGKTRELCEVEGLEGIAIDYHRFVDVVLPTTLWPKYHVVQDREYPEWDFGYHPAMIEKFKLLHGYDPREEDDPTSDLVWRQFRCDQITEVANLIADEVHAHGKKMSASPFPTPKMSARMVRQDWGQWDMDIVFPMVYTDFYTYDPSFAYDCCVENSRDAGGKMVLYCGLGVNFAGRPREAVVPELIKNCEAAFRGGAKGICLFTVDGLRTPEMRAEFKAYTDSIKAVCAAAGGVMPKVELPAAADPDPFSHPGLMKLVEQKIEALNGAPVELGDYVLTDEFNVTRDFTVGDKLSGAEFVVTFWLYGDMISGWDVRKK